MLIFPSKAKYTLKVPNIASSNKLKKLISFVC